MMISKTMQDAINEQINKEFYSSYLYLSMAANFADKNLPGFAKWLQVQTNEEREHGMKLYEHLLDRGGQVVLNAIAAPANQWKTALEAFREVQTHEAVVTASVNALYELALKEKDYPAQVLLHWFINEQVEEEAWCLEMVERVQAATCAGGLSDLDRHIERYLADAKGEK